MAQVKILVFAGSLRAGSFNKKLAKVAAEAVRKAGGEVTYLDLKDIPMPIYDGDLEDAEGLPPNGRKFKDLLLAHDGVLISSPEYNSSLPGVLKNAIDWASRPAPNEKPLECFTGKVYALLSASPGMLGGLRNLVVLRMLMGNIGAIVLPSQLAVSKAHEAFDDAGNLKDAKQLAMVEKIAKELVEATSRLKG